MRNVPGDGEPLLSTALERIFKECKLSIGFERTVAGKCFAPVMQLKLAALLPRVGIDPEGCQALEMIGASNRVDEMDRLVAAFETVFDERKRHAVFVVAALEQRADMTGFAEVRAGEGNGCPGAPHGVLLRGLEVLYGGIIAQPPADVHPCVGDATQRNDRSVDDFIRAQQ